MTSSGRSMALAAFLLVAASFNVDAFTPSSLHQSQTHHATTTSLAMMKDGENKNSNNNVLNGAVAFLSGLTVAAGVAFADPSVDMARPAFFDSATTTTSQRQSSSLSSSDVLLSIGAPRFGGGDSFETLDFSLPSYGEATKSDTLSPSSSSSSSLSLLLKRRNAKVPWRGMQSSRCGWQQCSAFVTRGGGLSMNSDDSEDDLSEYDSSESESESSEEVSEVFKGSFGTLEASAAIAETEEDQRKSSFLSAILWLALAGDSVLNTKKRELLFPSIASDVFTLECTTSLASGFIVAAALSLLQSITWKAPSSDALLTVDSQSTSSSNNMSLQRKTNMVVMAFALLHLPAHYHSSSGAPFLGMTAAYIAIYNAILQLNSFLKSVKPAPLVQSLQKDALSFVKSFFKLEMNKSSTLVYSVVALFASFRFVNVANQIWLLKSIQTIDSMKQMALHWSSLARYFLVGGLALLLKQHASSMEENNGDKNGNFVYRGLNGILSICSLGGKCVCVYVFVFTFVLLVFFFSV
mmetsp:Transcript_10403/g.15423  ORF Transcript_10403/g.15423 Transcript_10403/m.15423 type:complete len:522 (+) Transcript_10403:54-1619(+)